jgi:predicted Rossmann fold flavoprotein
VILAAGGQSVPKTGSDGSGYELARAFGHTVTPTFPALVPLVIEGDHWMKTISGTSVEAELRSGKTRERGSMLFTHFGLSGPVVLDISRHGGPLRASFLPDETFESLDAKLIAAKQGNLQSFFKKVLPERLVSHLVGADALTRLTREARRAAIHNVLDHALPPTHDRGFQYAEVTAGGVPLTEIDTATMESRVCPGLYLCGEILDVDGKIGGYNFQWAWASGRLAGRGASGGPAGAPAASPA